MRHALLTSIAVVLLAACVKPQIDDTTITGQDIPWTDSSNLHTQHTDFETLIRKYHAKGLPGISLLVEDRAGTWVGSVGSADLKTGIPFFAWNCF